MHKEARAGESETSKGKGDKGKCKGGKGGKQRQRGPCWLCGGPHLQHECPHASAGKQYPITTAWASWRPGASPGPTTQQWNSWLPKPKGGKKGASKGWSVSKGGNDNGKGSKGEGKGKGQVAEVQFPWGPPLGQVQFPGWDWDAGFDSESLVQLCNVRLQTPTEKMEDWEDVSKKRSFKSNGITIEKCQREYIQNSRCACIAPEDDGESECEENCASFPPLKAAAQCGRTCRRHPTRSRRR